MLYLIELDEFTEPDTIRISQIRKAMRSAVKINSQGELTMNARLIQPGVPQHVTPDQAIGAIMRQMEQVHHSLNLISIKVQTLQNALVNKGAIAVPELEKEWNALVDEMKTAARASIVTPEGVPLATKEEPKKEEETHGGILALSHPDHTPAGPVAGVAASAPQVDTKPVATTPELQPTPVAVPGHAA